MTYSLNICGLRTDVENQSRSPCSCDKRTFTLYHGGYTDIETPYPFFCCSEVEVCRNWYAERFAYYRRECDYQNTLFLYSSEHAYYNMLNYAQFWTLYELVEIVFGRHLFDNLKPVDFLKDSKQHYFDKDTEGWEVEKDFYVNTTFVTEPFRQRSCKRSVDLRLYARLSNKFFAVYRISELFPIILNVGLEKARDVFGFGGIRKNDTLGEIISVSLGKIKEIQQDKGVRLAVCRIDKSIKRIRRASKSFGAMEYAELEMLNTMTYILEQMAKAK